jgi:hypothetical protein
MNSSRRDSEECCAGKSSVVSFRTKWNVVFFSLVENKLVFSWPLMNTTADIGPPQYGMPPEPARREISLPRCE